MTGKVGARSDSPLGEGWDLDGTEVSITDPVKRAKTPDRQNILPFGTDSLSSAADHSTPQPPPATPISAAPPGATELAISISGTDTRERRKTNSPSLGAPSVSEVIIERKNPSCLEKWIVRFCNCCRSVKCCWCFKEWGKKS